MLSMEWVLLLAGLAAGALFAWIAAKGRIAATSEQVRRLTAELTHKTSELDAERQRANNAETAKATLEGEKSALEQARRLLPETFGALAADALRNNNQAFLDLAKEKLGAQHEAAKGDLNQKENAIKALLGPLETKFGEFKQEVENLKTEHVSGRTELREQITNLKSLNERLSADAESLVTALKGSSKTQGDWGEFVLEKLLQAAGLRKGIEYRVQETFDREEGGAARVDFILDLPDDRHMVIDSKVSLNDYHLYNKSDDPQVRKDALRRHLACIRAHIKELSERRYQELYSLNSLDFVLMFFPIEPAFLLAISNDDRIWQDAWDKDVVLVSPSGVFPVARSVAQVWRQERQARGVEEIVKRGKALYEKLVGFAEDLLAVGDSLRKAQDSYDEACRKLTTGKGNVIRQAEMLKSLGVKPTKSLPLALVEQAIDEDEPLALAAVGEESGPQPE